MNRFPCEDRSAVRTAAIGLRKSILSFGSNPLLKTSSNKHHRPSVESKKTKSGSRPLFNTGTSSYKIKISSPPHFAVNTVRRTERRSSSPLQRPPRASWFPYSGALNGRGRAVSSQPHPAAIQKTAFSASLNITLNLCSLLL